ncbi:hypothetical protein COCSUDRAFT_43577 [Coccomyxa subellipsoidea C-169]|uniref:INSIG-domain-containing protein n=1 Tax=Coccomyxa subellipsoidea (strain C-169) TaxID=574566 RepID=I0YSB2_COCSC|nr:hypothetical protein COCSUDRAFT_43577 [Coccomyxa subellipsoidea C-169]EIE21281.1 hypothetical protein COCSUDRAFT_43577 [Coccomyxa subellipsoidea C-169]|eukprot:XP_005645825.1 hypothetical protein COCSUDRAFT_43577 [Coccomyxa subellipsoidea C-169]
MQAQRQGVAEKAKSKAKETAQAAKQNGIIADLYEAQQALERSGVSIPELLGTCFLVGITFGTAFQVTHNNGFLPVYDVLPFKVGPFYQSGLVPLVLAPIWVLYGYLYPLLDSYFDDEAVSSASDKASNLRSVALLWASLAAMFILSDVLYLNNVPHWQISAILALAATANWAAFDGTRTGIILGALLAVGAPLSESVIVNVLGWWHYDRPDYLGVVLWAGWCYAAYAFGVGNFARYAVQQQRKNR